MFLYCIYVLSQGTLPTFLPRSQLSRGERARGGAGAPHESAVRALLVKGRALLLRGGSRREQQKRDVQREAMQVLFGMLRDFFEAFSESRLQSNTRYLNRCSKINADPPAAMPVSYTSQNFRSMSSLTASNF